MTDAQFDAIIAQVTAGEAVRRALRKLKVTPDSFYTAIARRPELAERYARAKVSGCERWADEISEISDEKPPKVATKFGEHTDAGFVQWQRNRIDSRKWLLSKLIPKVYGEKTTLASDPDNPIPPLVIIGGPRSDGSSSG